MAKSPCRRPDERQVKIHRSYSIEEAAACLNVHKNTVRAWIRNGLPLIERQRPFLIHGSDLVAFLKRRRIANKRPCGPGQLYCLRCRTPKAPAGGMADYAAKTAKTGDLVGICPDCDAMMYRRISWAHFAQVRGDLDVQIVQAHLRLAEDASPSVNCNLDQGVMRDAA